MGTASALLFLLLSNPAFTRVGGVRLRAQAETFIALAVTAGFLFLVRDRDRQRRSAVFAAGVMLGIACVFKYNTAVYGAAMVAVCGCGSDCRHRQPGDVGVPASASRSS